MKFTNREVKTVYEGLRTLLFRVDEESKRPVQRDLPMIPTIHLKRTLEDLEGLYETAKEALDDKRDKVDDFLDSLKEKVDDDEIEYGQDDLREEFNDYTEEKDKEAKEFLDQEVEVTLSDPITESDVERFDKAGNFPYAATQAVELLLVKQEKSDGDK